MYKIARFTGFDDSAVVTVKAPPMKVDRNKQICGVKPALLKSLLKLESFTTIEAMKILDLGEPEITDALIALEGAGWLQFTSVNDGVDNWKITQKGRRLTATSLLKRISPDDGKKIIVALLDEVRRINAEPLAVQRISKVILFGSMLPSRRPKTVGDVDIVIETTKRKLSAEELTRANEAERLKRPAGLSFLAGLCWPQTRLLLQLKRISRYISLHEGTDLQSGAPHQEIYVYDTMNEQEREPCSKILRRRGAPRVEAAPNSPVVVPNEPPPSGSQTCSP